MQLLDLLQKKQRIADHPYRHGGYADGLTDHGNGLYHEQYFCEMLNIERKRAERSRKPFVLMLVDLREFGEGYEKYGIARKIMDALTLLVRDTDLKGWYRHGHIVGVIFTEIGVNGKSIKATQKNLVDKHNNVLKKALDAIEFEKVLVTWHAFPGHLDKVFFDGSPYVDVYPNVFNNGKKKKRFSHSLKRGVDVFGSISALVFFSPLFCIIALLIKLSSEGPVFFRQERVGLLGKRFSFIKFRSMYRDNDPTIHREFVKNLIAGEKDKNGDGEGGSHEDVYKITHDPRVTPIGNFLRKASLDELPQFINVLMGDMSLVGPRPPIPYECAEYDIWHRRRVLEMKPGITGLWQVKGRSSTTFDEMVRMDIQYIRDWSLWMDIKIILKTPWAVIKGKGAY